MFRLWRQQFVAWARYITHKAKIPAKRIAFYWGALALILSIGAGWSLSLFNIVFLSPFGLLLATRLGIQISRAERNNRRFRTSDRGALLEAVEQVFPYVDTANLLTHEAYDKWREKIWREIPDAKARWNEIINLAVKNAAGDRPIPTVGIEMPVHGLTHEEIVESLLSMQSQSFGNISTIILAFNDPTNKVSWTEVLDTWKELGREDTRLEVVNMPEARKRDAMAEAFRELIYKYKVDLVLNVDGDTRLDRDAVAIGVLTMLLDSRVRAITSNVRVQNRYENLLTELTYQRYVFANLLERAGQSWQYAVTCMSGPYMLMWANDLAIILEQPELWEKQRFLGELVGPGDDRRLTTIYNMFGWGVVFVCDVIVYTDCPSDMEHFKKQQVRWNRSGDREFFAALSTDEYWENVPAWSILDYFYLISFSFLLLGIITGIIARTIYAAVTVGVTASFELILPYLLILAAMNALRMFYGMWITKDLRFWRSFFYLILHIYPLTHLKMYALITLTNSLWLTRDQKSNL